MVQEGEFGEVVVTTLTRQGMPLIRYRMDDQSRFIHGDCPCGTRLKNLETISGRFSSFVNIGEDVLKMRDFDEALFPISGLLNFSVTVAGSTKKPSLTVEIQMLTTEDSAGLIEQALRTIKSVKICI